MNRMQSFEQSWAARHGVPVESMVQYRFESREGYRLPDMAAHYRTYCDALDSLSVTLPQRINPPGRVYKLSNYDPEEARMEAWDEALEACFDAIMSSGLHVVLPISERGTP